jgi:cell wall-associated NlpC family hydrolase
MTGIRRSWVQKRITARVVAALMTIVATLPALSQVDSHAAPKRAQLQAAEERLHELERDFEIVVEDYNLVTERLEDIQIEIAKTRLFVDRTERRMSVRQETADAVATELYKGGSATGLEAVLGAETLADADTRLLYLQESEDAQLEVFESLDVIRLELEVRVADLEDAQARAREAEERLNGLREEIESKLVDQEDEIAQLNRQIEAAARRREAREQAALEAARREAAAVAQVLPGSTNVEAPPPPKGNSAGAVAVRAALSQLGKPYVWAAEGPDSYDCSGLTLWAWARAGVSLPHNSGMQYAATKRVDRSDWQPGDLLFFGSPIHHVGMYIGDGQMVEAPYTGQVVRVISASRSDYVGAGRPGV